MADVAGSLTAALVAAPDHAPSAQGGDDATAAVRDRLDRIVPELVEDSDRRGGTVMSLHRLRQMRREPDGPDEPFAWKPAFVRRSLGLAAIDACLDRTVGGPAAAVGPVADAAVSEWQRTGWRTFHWEPWLANLGSAARAAVLAEATTWATAVWTSVDWARLPARPRLGGPDDRWTCPTASGVHLVARSEIKVALDDGRHPDGAGGGLAALVSIAGGAPRRGWESELGYLAMVGRLGPLGGARPVRVVGLWPEAGEHRVVEVTEPVLSAACDLALEGLRAALGRGGTSPCRAAC